MFKRRDRRTWLESIRAFLWPRGGWARAFSYVKLRVQRLPDSPQKIGRGIWAGIFVCFTPFFGLHFVFAAIIAKVMRGNILASLLSTFFGNPLTFPAIALASVQVGNFLLGRRQSDSGGRFWSNLAEFWRQLWARFGDAWRDLKFNFWAMFSDDRADWRGLWRFYDEVFFPYMVGGLVPGVIVATIIYYITVPMIDAFQSRRRKILRAKLAQLKNPPGSGPGEG